MAIRAVHESKLHSLREAETLDRKLGSIDHPSVTTPIGLLFGKPSDIAEFDDKLNVSHLCAEASKAVGVAGGRVCTSTTFLFDNAAAVRRRSGPILPGGSFCR